MARQMKDSGIEWIGEIPEGWRIRKGKWILEHLERPVLPDDGVITCFRDGEVTLRSNRREDGFTFSLQEAGYQGIEPGDLVVHGMDGFAGAIGISDSRGKGTPVLNVLDSTENKKYLTYFLRTMAHNGIFLALSTGIRVRSCDTNWNKLKELQYVLPPSDEQERIVAFLNRKCAEIDAVIERTKATIEEYKKLKQAVITEAVTKGVRGRRPMKDSGIEWMGETPNDWVFAKLKSYYSFEKGKNAAQYTQEYIGAHGGKYPVYSGQTENSGVMGSIDSFDYDISTCLFTTTVGAKVMTPRILHGKFSLSQNCLIMKPHKQCCVEYFYYALCTLFGYEKSLIPSHMQPSLRIEDMKKYGFYLPGYDEQMEIAVYLDERCAALDTLIAKKTALLTELETYKKSLIYEYVTGKKKV